MLTNPWNHCVEYVNKEVVCKNKASFTVLIEAHDTRHKDNELELASE